MSRIAGFFARISEIWAELSYAQRRSFEIQTGVPVGARRKAPRSRARTVAELERLWAIEDN
jgi:hypothetical protein